ncbi:peptidoglycan DD-metalloendopeptidase family protein [Cytobacillus purgationiresistens]|uniref:Murein DD-endopeptidase MepM/ murein hydrolase activator NlpD n=1 Tax=Cytobacillus purgationiresistens TaxID=863449 RepID=A0ABU0AIN4_9BACI|nr:peptidoglycan DD-metalloendopeptidase family protein [Cytobacillus purgationiresistens]MDQ0271122.1 murein DD-endopeptidase MepM/ murein hydrolase activator NlpD [Cytobacillus purgationiresistens]
MKDYIRRFLIAGVMAICVSLLFLGGKSAKAETDFQAMTSQWVWPSEGVITDTFGTRKGQHKGIDIAAELGTPIHAVDSGIVVRSYFSDSYGNVVFIRHDNQTETVYAHLQNRVVSEGQAVAAGQEIGAMGNTGDSSGVHLHFEIHKNEWTFNKENAIDPFIAFNDKEIGHAVVVSGQGEKKVDDEALSDENGFLPYLVQQGDSLWSIAEKHGISVEMLMDENNLLHEEIGLGQTLTIPKRAEESTYIVRSGDTLTAIAIKYDMPIDQLVQVNHINNDTIYPQQVLIIQKNE